MTKTRIDYEPTQVVPDHFVTSLPWFAVFDQAEGFQPAYCAVQADNEGCAAEIASDLDSRWDEDSETLVVVQLEGAPS